MDIFKRLRPQAALNTAPEQHVLQLPNLDAHVNEVLPGHDSLNLQNVTLSRYVTLERDVVADLFP